MRYRITGAGWRLDNVVVPANTIIDASANDQWSQRAKGKPIPLSAIPLDEQAWSEQVRLYAADYGHLLRGGWR